MKHRCVRDGTIQLTMLIDKTLQKDFIKAKDYPRQTHNEFLRKILNRYLLFKGVQVDTANINSLQKSKMSEIWNSKEDEVWDEI